MLNNLIFFIEVHGLITWLKKQCIDILLVALSYAGLILGLRPANERRRNKVTPSLFGWVQT